MSPTDPLKEGQLVGAAACFALALAIGYTLVVPPVPVPADQDALYATRVLWVARGR